MALSALTLTGCSDDSLEFDEQLVVSMYGVFEAPADAMGNSEPKYQIYTLEDVTMTAEDGAVVDLYEADPKDFRIINRSQIIAEASIHDHVDKTFTSMQVTFAADVRGGGTTGELAATLPARVVTLTEPFVVQTGKSRRLKVEVQWKDTVFLDETTDPKTETMSAPTFSLALTANSAE